MSTRRELKNKQVFLIYHITRIRGSAIYTSVIEASGKVNGIGEISHPSPSKTLGPIWMRLQIYHYVPRGSRCAKFG